MLIRCIFHPCLKFLFPFQRWWVRIKRLLSYGLMGFQSYLMEWATVKINLFKKGNCFAMELGYSVEDLMDCVRTHDFMRDKCIFFPVTSTLKELPTLSPEKNSGSKYQHSLVQWGGKYFPKYITNHLLQLCSKNACLKWHQWGGGGGMYLFLMIFFSSPKWLENSQNSFFPLFPRLF